MIKVKRNIYLFLFSCGLVSCFPAPEVAGQFTPKEFDDMATSMAKGDVDDITVDELKAIQENVTLLDAREIEEYNTSHIKGARYVGHKDFKVENLDGIDKDKPLVIYCSVGYRSERIGEKLLKLGYKNVKNLKGSIFDWVNKGNPVVNMKGLPTQQVHGYDSKWSKWLKVGEVTF